jgi:hypothetical protein
MSIYLYASSLYNICHISLRYSPELEECTPDPDHYLPAHITTIYARSLIASQIKINFRNAKRYTIGFASKH